MLGRHILSGVVACLSGFDAEERANITEKVQRHGGEMRCELTDKVTHLIAHTLRGAKVRRVINCPRETPPHLVPLLWLERSIADGRKEAETGYDPRRGLCASSGTSGDDVRAVVESFGPQVLATPLLFMHARSCCPAPVTTRADPLQPATLVFCADFRRDAFHAWGAAR